MTRTPSTVIHRHYTRTSKAITIFDADQGLGERLTAPVTASTPSPRCPPHSRTSPLAPLGKMAITVA